MNRIALLLSLSLLFAAPAGSAPAPEAEARAVIDATVADVLAHLANDDLTLDQKRAHITDVAYERFDFETMSKLVLKRDWRKFSDEQKSRFVVAFRTYLANNYGSRLTRYHQEAIDMVGEKLEKRGDVTVRTIIRGGDASGASIDYRLRNRDGQWRIIDVVIEGISLVSNFRSQFADVLHQGGPDELLARLEARNAEAAATTADAKPADDTPGDETGDALGPDATATAL